MLELREVVLDSEKEEVINFLKKNHIDYEHDITYTVSVYDGDEMVATGSLSGKIMKCFLVRSDYKNQNITTMIFTHLVHFLTEKGINHYFVFTTIDNEKIFKSYHMKTIVKTMNTVLLEGGDTIDNVLGNLKLSYGISNNPKAAIVMNANPMTNGHLYLVEKAAEENSEVLVFVVSEDVSKFPFKDRFEIIKKATKHLPNVTVLPTLDYLVSKITFPKYFLKEDQLVKDEQTLVDVLIYKEYFVPIFNIELRYLGSEPFSYNTNKYNDVLKDYLNSHVKIIERKKYKTNPISASLIRKLIKANKIDKIEPYVPSATYEYLQSEKGQKVIKTIQESDLSRH